MDQANLGLLSILCILVEYPWVGQLTSLLLNLLICKSIETCSYSSRLLRGFNDGRCTKHVVGAEYIWNVPEGGSKVLPFQSKCTVLVPDQETWRSFIRLSWSLHSRSPRMIIPLLEKTKRQVCLFFPDPWWETVYSQNIACLPAIHQSSCGCEINTGLGPLREGLYGFSEVQIPVQR